MHAFSVLFQSCKLFSTSVNASWRWTTELRLFWSFYIHVFLVSCSGVSQSLLASGVHRARQGQQQMLRQDHLQQTRQRKIRATKMQPTNVPESVAATSLSSWFIFFLCLTAGSSHRFPLPRTECRRGDAGLRCSHEVWRHQRTVGHHHWHPPNLCWGKKTMLPLYLLGYLPVLVDCLRSCVYVFRMGFVFWGGDT